MPSRGTAWRIVRKIENAIWEWKLGIRTRGLYYPEGSGDEYIHYGTLSFATARAVLDGLRLSEDDVFIDLGCGKGRVICLASLQVLREVIGVEYSAPLCEQARLNAGRLAGKRSALRVWEGLAEEFDYSKGTVFYMFHPFGPMTLELVLKKMWHDTGAHGQPIRLAYVNPVHDGVCERSGWLECYARWDSGIRPDIEVGVSFWRTRADVLSSRKDPDTA